MLSAPSQQACTLHWHCCVTMTHTHTHTHVIPVINCLLSLAEYCVCRCVCVYAMKKQQSSSRSVTLQHCQFTSSHTYAAAPSHSPPLKINLRHMHACTYSAYSILHKGYINFTSCWIGPAGGRGLLYISAGEHAHTTVSLF